MDWSRNKLSFKRILETIRENGEVDEQTNFLKIDWPADQKMSQCIATFALMAWKIKITSSLNSPSPKLFCD